jgi:Tfp pilus assembly protein PilX
MNRNKQKGMALVMVIILLVVLSVMATSLMFLSQTETWSSANYRLMTQARYGAEAGVNSAVNYLMNSYTPPAGPFTGYVVNATGVTFEGDSVGVTYGGHPVVLSTTSSAANYPVSSTETAFRSAAAGSLTADNTTVNYSAHATLLSMVSVVPFGGTSSAPVTIQTWKVTGDATIAGAASAQVEVSSILERQFSPVFTYAAFATNNGCAAMTFGGGGTTGSYDSSALVGGAAVISASGGNVGTNGNLVTNGNPTVINGSLSTPRTGVGACSSSNITALTGSGTSVTGGEIELPQPILYPTPTINPDGTLDVSAGHNASCPSGTGAPPVWTASNNTTAQKSQMCYASGGDLYLPPSTLPFGVTPMPGYTAPSYHNIGVTGNETLHLYPGTYNINTLSEQSAQSSIVIEPDPVLGPGPVMIYVTGTGGGTVVDLTGNSVQNATLVPTMFQIFYAGTGSVALKGNSQASGLLYAPNATFSFTGQARWYGAVIGANMSDMGGAAIYYDRRLSNAVATPGNYMLNSFTWKKY